MDYLFIKSVASSEHCTLTSDKHLVNASFASGVYFVKGIDNDLILVTRKLIKE